MNIRWPATFFSSHTTPLKFRPAGALRKEYGSYLETTQLNMALKNPGTINNKQARARTHADTHTHTNYTQQNDTNINTTNPTKHIHIYVYMSDISKERGSIPGAHSGPEAAVTPARSGGNFSPVPMGRASAVGLLDMI